MSGKGTVNAEIEASWKAQLSAQFEAPYFADLQAFLKKERQQNRVIYPEEDQIFNAFNHTPFDDVKAVILGQDPYHGPGQAHGLCFSVQDGMKPPPSLVNIFKEMESDLGLARPTSGNLENWAKQGVLLINATLSVQKKQAGSHQEKGWETFTDAVIKQVSDQREGVVFILWGRFAQNKAALIDHNRHHVLTAAHPSPFSAYKGFLGCKHFSKTNELLVKQNIKPIDWSLT
jgi:uracil-DNA glycosylase